MDKIINNPTTTIIDVRTEGEFMSGHVSGSINIPLDQIPNKVEEIKLMSAPLVLCCMSGGRSGQAIEFLKTQSVDDLHNGGGWTDVQLHKA